jgi:hypothetical protein
MWFIHEQQQAVFFLKKVKYLNNSCWLLHRRFGNIPYTTSQSSASGKRAEGVPATADRNKSAGKETKKNIVKFFLAHK